LPTELTFDWVGELSLTSLIFNLAIGLVLAIILSWHYRRFGSTLSNREELSSVLPFVLLTTILIISVVKSSLALSLGLVGALSIVRFRTPIKEPEELAYLFLAIAIGLGLGASQTAPTMIASLLILAVMAAFRYRRLREENRNLFLSIDLDIGQEKDSERYLGRLNQLIRSHTAEADLRRFDLRNSTIEAVYFVDVSSVDNLDSLIHELNSAFPRIGVSFLDQNNLAHI
jgi:hypothetical protein